MPKPTEPKCPKRIRCWAWSSDSARTPFMVSSWEPHPPFHRGHFLPDAELAALDADAAAWRKHKRAAKKAKKKGAKRRA